MLRIADYGHTKCLDFYIFGVLLFKVIFIENIHFDERLRFFLHILEASADKKIYIPKYRMIIQLRNKKHSWKLRDATMLSKTGFISKKCWPYILS